MDRLKRWYYYIILYFHALFYGLKTADDLIRVNKNISSFQVGVEHCIGITNIWAELLRGELTEQVKQLRYTIYKVNEEADRYKYIGNGVCVKKEAKTRNKPVIVQEQRDDIQNYTWALNQLQKTDSESIRNFINIKTKKLINIEYKMFPSLQFNDNIEKIKIDKNRRTAILSMSMDLGYTPKSKRIAKYLESSLNSYNNLDDVWTKMRFLYKNELFGNINDIIVKTYKCDGEYDDNIYRLQGVYPVSITVSNNIHTLDFELRFDRLCIDNIFTIEQVFNKEQQDRYDKKQRKAPTCIEFADAICLCHKDDEIDVDAIRKLELTEFKLDAFKA